MTAQVQQAAEAPVGFQTRAAGNGKQIGIATLNAPKTLNGLSLDNMGGLLSR